MNLRDKISVPPMDEMRARRVERAVLEAAQQTQRRRRKGVYLPWVFVTSALAAAAVALFALRTEHVAIGELRPTLVSSGSSSDTVLKLGGDSIVLAPNTVLSLQSFPNGAVKVYLGMGGVLCDVEPRPERPGFSVVADEVVTEVVGTRFEVFRDPEVRVVVHRGKVAVSQGQVRSLVAQGELWISGEVQPQIALSTPTDASEMLANTETGAPAKEVRANRPHESSSTTERAATTKTGHDDPAVEEALSAPAAPKEAASLGEALKGARPIPPVILPSHGDEVAALQKQRRGAPAKVAEELADLSLRTTGDTASIALYLRAHILFYDLKDSQTLAIAAERYHRRFPQGPHAEDMLWLAVKAACEKDLVADDGLSTLCRRQAHTYVARYPQGIFRGLAGRIVARSANETSE